MKLHELEIQSYKNLSGKYSFKDNSGYIALIGLNGSGKSNLLETISFLFFKIMGIQDNVPFADYSLIYEIRDHGVDIIEGDSLGNGSITMDDLPSSVIACYSGEDDRLWESGFKDYYTKFFNAAIGGGEYKPKALYVNKRCWKIAFISLLFSENEKIKRFISDTLKINAESVRIQFITKTSTKVQEHDASNWYQRVDKKFNNSAIKIEDLKTDEDVPLGCNMYPELTNDQVIFYYLYFLYTPNKQVSPGLNADNVIDSINITVNGFEFDNLSEGEKKLILIECITKVLGDENSLVLFDEPDAHVHIGLKKEILNCINDFEGQVLLTTHSPIFVNQMTDKNIYPMVNGKVLPQAKRELIQKITNNEINYLDGACIVSSKYVLVTEGPDDIYHIKAAISAFSSLDDKFKELDKISFIYMGGAKGVDNYFDEILKSLYDTMTKIVFAFDYDEEGREGAKMVQRLIDSGNNKLQYVYYHKTYPVPAPNIDFYLEDFFGRSAYVDVQLPSINGVPSFAELKKASTWANSIKKRIQKHKSDNSLSPEEYNGFQAFLEQLISSFEL